MLGTLGSPIEFKPIILMNLIIHEKYNIICFSLDNATKCLNSIEKLNIPNLCNCTYVLP